MSTIHNIFYQRPLEISEIEIIVSNINEAVFEDRGNGVFYFWIEGKSTRGFDITIEDGYIEVRNTILSNVHDYELTNKIISEIMALTDGIIKNEDDDENILILPIFDISRISESEIHDCESIKFLSKEYEDVAIYGPIRKVHFGRRLYQDYKELNGEKLRDKIFEIILNVNYYIPNFEYGNIINFGDSDEDKKVIKLLTNEVDCIIDKYDYILFNNSSLEKPIKITNQILNSILPSSWQLVDEFTVVAPIIEETEWDKLIKNASEFNMWDEFVKNNSRK